MLKATNKMRLLINMKKTKTNSAVKSSLCLPKKAATYCDL